jgi:hypothetical protein
MKTWADLTDRFLTDLNGATYPAMASALLLAAREFCAKSHVWRVRLAPVTVTNGQGGYSYPLQAGQQIEKVLRAWADGSEVKVFTAEQGGERDQGNGVLASLTSFNLNGVFGVGQKVVLEVVLKPSDAATGLEDFIADQFAEDIAYGAKARMYKSFNQPYSNIDQASIARTDFDAAIARAAMRVAKAYSTAPLRVRASFM